MIFPYATDAPVYHWPYGTIGLIAANFLVFFAAAFGLLPQEMLVLEYGALKPAQWIGSVFMHAGLGHLLGNMIFLWVFGLIVEGKLGPARFLACYLGLGVAQSMLEQLAMLWWSGAPAGSLGASAALYALLAIATVWSPANNINFFYWLFFFLVGTVDVPIGVAAGLYVGFDLLIAFLTGDPTSLLQISGAALGFPVGVALLRRGVVDCEGWDLFSRLGNTKRARDKKRADEEAEAEERRRLFDTKQIEHLRGAQQQFQEYVNEGNSLAAWRLYTKMAGVREGLALEATHLAAMIKGLHAEQKWRESAPLMADLIERSPTHSDGVRLKLAQICVVELGRPGRALELIAALDAGNLDEAHRGLAKKIVARARQMQAEGHVELDDGGW